MQSLITQYASETNSSQLPRENRDALISKREKKVTPQEERKVLKESREC